MRSPVALAIALAVACAGPREAPHPTAPPPSTEATSGPPVAEPAPSCHQARSPFVASGPPRIVIATLAGLDLAVGRELAQRIEDELRKFEDERVAAGAPRLFQLARVTDVVRSHGAARGCAEQLGADLVLWGTIESNPQLAAGDLHTDVKVGSVTTGANSTVSIGTVVLGGKPFTFLPSITLRRKDHWIQSSSRLDLFSLADIDFDALGADRSLFLIPFLAGAAALEHADLARAVAMFGQASRGEASATGLARVYAATYLGAVQLSSEQPELARQTLEVPAADLAVAPPTLVWQNRMLSARAAEETDALTRARDGFAAAEAVTGIPPELTTLASLAQTWVLLYLSEAATALAKVEPLLARCAASGCSPGSFTRIRLLVLKSLSLGILGDHPSAQQCFREFAHESEALLSDPQMKEALRKRADELIGRKRDPDAPLDVFDAIQHQLVGCMAVHWTWGLPQMLREDDINSAVSTFDYIEQGRGTLGQVFDRLGSSRMRAAGLRGLACQYAIAAYNAGNASVARDLAHRAASPEPPSKLTTAELELLLALLDAHDGRSRDAKSRAAFQLPVLRAAMGPDAASVRVWERFVATGKMGPYATTVPRFTPCRP